MHFDVTPFTFRKCIFVVIFRDLPVLAILVFSELLSAFLPMWYPLTLLLLGNFYMFLESVENMSSSFAEYRDPAVFVIVINCVVLHVIWEEKKEDTISHRHVLTGSPSFDCPHHCLSLIPLTWLRL